VPIVAPVIKETELVHDSLGSTNNNGSFMVYESMKWKDSHLVTVKRLHANAVQGGCADLLIQEQKFLSKINFSKIIQFLGICQTENIESLVLMFERIAIGSLYNVLHEMKLTKKPKLKSIVEIMSTTCDALIYLHEQNIIHCYVSSHSIMLVTPHTCKLANLEYAVERASEPSKQKRSNVVDNHYNNCVWNWLAPELMLGDEAVPNFMSDMYGFCTVFWELFNVDIPWRNMTWSNIRDELWMRGNSLSINFDLIPVPFSRIIKDGLSLQPIKRMSFEEVKANLESFQHAFLSTRNNNNNHQHHHHHQHQHHLNKHSLSIKKTKTSIGEEKASAPHTEINTIKRQNSLNLSEEKREHRAYKKLSLSEEATNNLAVANTVKNAPRPANNEHELATLDDDSVEELDDSDDDDEDDGNEEDDEDDGDYDDDSGTNDDDDKEDENNNNNTRLSANSFIRCDAYK
jgi:serine/threonine protein kinase